MNNPSRYTFVAILAALLVAGTAASQDTADGFDTDEQRLFYFMGMLYGKNLQPLHLDDTELKLVIRGVNEAAAGKATQLDPAIYGPKLQQLGLERRAQLMDEERPKAAAYLKAMAAEDGAQTTDSGLIFRMLAAGSGAQPAAESIVKVHYHGTLRDGTVFDSSVERGQPLDMPLNRVIPCWQEGIAMLKVGGKAQLTCPAELAYGDRGVAGIPPGAAISFEVELIDIVR